MSARAFGYGASNAADIARALGGRRSGASWLCRCPAHDDHDPSLRITETKVGKVLVKCWSGCEQEAVIDELRRKGLWAGKPSHVATWGRKTSPDSAADSDKARDPMKPWREARDLTHGCTPNRYLRNRVGDLAPSETSNLRFSSDQYHWPSKSNWSCLIARVSHASGDVLGSHLTFINRDGGAKAPLGDQARLFSAGSRTTGGGVWLGTIDPNRELVVGEGLESTLSGMRIFGAQAGVAALSAGGIRALVLPEVQKVRIFADHDELGQGLSAAREAGRRWLAEGRTVAVSISPTVGEDANDVWLRRSR